ncbi:MAG: hypothetical protein K2I95_08545 [Treponemataceae bacterium]|nr:hypothetical protein [Treponemataceae bacterium]
MKKPILFLTLILSFAWDMFARKWRIADSIEQAKSFIYMYYKEYDMLPDSLENLEKLVQRKMGIKNYFENENESGFYYRLELFTENLLWLSVEKEEENQSLLYMADTQQIIVFSGIKPLYKYVITSSGEIADYYAYDKEYDRMDSYEDNYVPKSGKIPQESYEVIESPRFLCE